MSTPTDTAVLDELLGEVPEETAPGAGGDGADGTTGAPSEEEKRRRRLIAWFIIGALVLVGGLFGWYLMTRKPLTEALPGVNDARPPSYKYSVYDLVQPLGVAVTADGSRIYVTEGGVAQDVKVIGKDGKATGTLPLPKDTAHQPMYVAVDRDNGEVFVTDRLTKKIYVFSKDAKYLRTVEPKGDLGDHFAPLAIAVDKDHNVYVTDVSGGTDDASGQPKAHRVVVLDKSGKVIRIWGQGELSFPNGIAVADNGLVYVTDSNNGRMLVIDKTGKTVATIARGIGEGDLGLPRGIGLDDSGRLLVVDTTDHMVRTYQVQDDPSKAPVFIVNFGDQGRADGQFEFPNGLATDTRARIYVTDRENARLQVWGY